MSLLARLPRTPEAEREALESMIQSEGWAIYMEHVAIAWGSDACEFRLREAREKIRKGDLDPSEWPFESARILDTFDGMRSDLRWPEARIQALKGNKPDQAPFRKFMRGIR